MILVADSGVGGLTVARAIAGLRPGLPMTYLADHGGFPYGDLPDAALTARLLRLLGGAVNRLRPAALVVACNTASTVALAALRAALPVPVIGCVPPIKPAAALSRTGHVGLLATPATVRRAYVQDLARRHAPGAALHSHGSPRLAALAEAAFRGETPDPAILRAELAALLDPPEAGAIDVVALGCTHYAFLLPQLRALAPGVAHWLDPAEGVARRTLAVLGDAPAGAEGSDGPNGGGVALLTAPPAPGLAAGLARFGFPIVRTVDEAARPI